MRFYTERPQPHPGVEVFPEEEYSDQETRYDAFGRRVWVKTRHIPTIPGADCGEFCSVERFVWDGDQLLAEFRMPDTIAELDTAIVYDLVQESNDILNPPPPIRQYSWLWGQVLYTHGLGMDQPLAVHRAGAGVDTLDLSSFAMYPLHDWRGNATAIAFAGGRPLFNGNVRYTPPLPTDENKLLTAYRERTHDSRRVTSWMGSLLTGQMTAMGLEYRRNRYYDPKSGRFTQEDPIGLGGGLNLYGFGGGDPVNNSDPFGLCPMCVGAAAGVAEGFLIAKLTGQEYTWKDAAVDAALGAAGAGLIEKLNDLRKAERGLGVIYRRLNPKRQTYIGRSKSEAAFLRRQLAHDTKLGAKHEYEVIARAGNGTDLRVAEESVIRRRWPRQAREQAVRNERRGVPGCQQPSFRNPRPR